MTRLSVNLNKVALLRNTRTVGVPDVLKAGRIALEAGAHGITVHPRPDGRHIRREDVTALAGLLKAWPAAEFNIEGNPFHGLMDIAEETQPTQCTLVPDDPGAATSDHGWNLDRDGDRLKEVVRKLKQRGIRVSLFMDPVPEAIKQARNVGADRVELYTEPYAQSAGTSGAATELQRYVDAASVAASVGLGVNAGHDLNLANLPSFIRAIPAIAEVSIGHALIADALEYGLSKTVRLYIEALGGNAIQAKGEGRT